MEILCGRLQEHDLGQTSMVADTPESSRSFLGVTHVLLRAGAQRKDGRTEERARRERVDEIILLKTENTENNLNLIPIC